MSSFKYYVSMRHIFKSESTDYIITRAMLMYVERGLDTAGHEWQQLVKLVLSR